MGRPSQFTESQREAIRRDTRPLSLLQATPEHVYSLMTDVRQEDNEEWVAASGSRTGPLLLRAVLAGYTNARAIVDEQGRTLTIHGVTPSEDPEVGIAWLIASKLAVKRHLSIHRHFDQGLAEMHSVYPVLVCWAYSRNQLHHDWLLRFGFEKTGRRLEMGMGFSFVQFVHHRKD